MTQSLPSDYQWVAADLHVHTPASKDYRGERSDEEFFRILREANAFGESTKHPIGQRPPSAIGCIAVTDHNTVDGFSNFRRLQQKTLALLEDVARISPGNQLVEQLQERNTVLQAIHVLMGVEVNVNPGIHFVFIFQETVTPEAVIAFLEKIYGAPYDHINGETTPLTACTLQAVLDDALAQFGDRVLVIPAHIDSDAGLYEGLREHGQLRAAAFRHPALNALGFNKPETRDRVSQLLRQPDYKRSGCLPFIQASDFHGREAEVIGSVRTQFAVAHGKATFRNIREALGVASRIKTSLDSATEDYEALTKGEFLYRLQLSSGGSLTEQAVGDAAKHVCAMINSDGGILEFDMAIDPTATADAIWERTRDAVLEPIRKCLDPGFRRFNLRNFRLSPGKIRTLINFDRSRKLNLVKDSAYIVRGQNATVADASDIEWIVAGNIDRRFGNRLYSSLKRVSSSAIVLADFPASVALALRCDPVLRYGNSDKLILLPVEPPNSAERNAAVRDLARSLVRTTPYGSLKGSVAVFNNVPPPRFRHHYHRLSVRAFEVASPVMEQFDSVTDHDDRVLVVLAGGAVYIAEAGQILSSVPFIILRCAPPWQDRLDGLAAWLKSSFFLWYCAVHLGSPDLFRHFQRTPEKLPIPSSSAELLWKSLGASAANLLIDEKRFVDEINRKKRRGESSADLQKLEDRHNSSANKHCITLDKEIYEHLGLSVDDGRRIASQLRNLGLADFGWLDEAEEADREALEG